VPLASFAPAARHRGALLRTAVAVALLCSCCAAPAADPTGTARALLARSAAAWNAGDLDGFVSDYATDSGTTFVSGGRARSGFDWIRSHYAPAFAPGSPHDSVRFEEIAARALGADYILVTARFALTRHDSVTSSGPFTLVLHRQHDTWKIIHDHTASDPR
jgi:uncharacterized protein (TIGR02246 family)